MTTTHDTERPGCAAPTGLPSARATAIRAGTGRAARMARAAASALAAIPLALLPASCSKAAKEAAAKPRAVRAAPAERGDFVLWTEYAARLAPARQVNVTPKVGGRVASVDVEVGALVRAGQTLFVLEGSDYEAQHRQAMGALESARASLERTSDAGQEQQILQARAGLDQAQVLHDEARNAFDRTKRLYEAGVIARAPFDEVEARYKAAVIQLDAARKNLDLVRDKAGPQSNDIASGQVDQARALADLAKSRLDATVVRSPIAGRIAYRRVEAGEFVDTSTLAFVVIDDSSFLAEAGLSERVVGLVAPGTSVSLKVEALARELAGMVDTVAPSPDPRTHLYQVRIRLPRTEGLKSGMLAKLRFPVERRPGAVLVPERAVFAEAGGSSVFVVEDGVARKRRIVLGESDGSVVEVAEGLRVGELVVIEGQEFIATGDKVEVLH